MVALRGEALLQLIIGSTILPAIIYGATTVVYPLGAKTPRRKEGAFSLERFELPVAYAALIWVVIALLALVSPLDALIPDPIDVGLILIGGLYFAKMTIFNREVLGNRAWGTRRFLTTLEGLPRQHVGSIGANS
jgi:hypothetical protein